MRIIGLTILLSALAHAAAFGQLRTGGEDPAGASAAVAIASRAVAAPVLDGRLNEEVWNTAAVVSGFTQREPDEGAPAAESTELRILFTDEALFIGARMYGSPDQIRADVTRRDVEGDAEQLVVSLDTFLDRRTAYTFAVTAAGGRIDYLHPSDNEGNRDYSFDPVWETEAVVDGDGWTAELRIPFTQLRFNASEEQVWGLNVKRVRPALQSESLWQLVRRDETGWSSRMGRLEGIRDLPASRRIELQPYLASSGTLVSGVDADNPFEDPRELSMRVGGDLKVGLGPNLTLDATLNPDFGQVEADPAIVNLGAFEVFYQERRPFFTEGARLFSFGDLFYSRRIGARPPGQVDADYVDDLESTTILGAAKVTGRLPSGLSIGVLGAVTDEESTSTYDAASDQFGRSVVAPLSGYGAARLEQQFGADGSTIGAIVTGVRRDLGGLENLSETLTSTAVAAGFDGRLRWRGGEYDLNWSAVATNISGSPDAILLQQRISRRYFQRPDADYVEVDPTRTSLTGYMLELGHSRQGAEHWLWDIDLWAESPGYEPNDLGRLGSTDGIGGFGGLTYRETTPGRYFRNYAIRFMSEQEWNYGGEWTGAWYGLNLSGQLPNFWRAEMGFDYNPQILNPWLTRGGPLMRRSGFQGPFVAFASPAGNRVQMTLRTGGGWRPGGGWSFWSEPQVSYRPIPRLELSLQPMYRRYVDPQQYVATRDGGPPGAFGSRYIFGQIEYRQIAARIRANYALGPDFTLEAYLEPFASSGQYSNFGELVAARGNELRIYGEGEALLAREGDGDYRVTDGSQSFTFQDPAFHLRSFRSNVVMRWEWRRGSTLYVVWQQDRSGDGEPGDRAVPDDLLRSLRAAGDNLLAIKATYWLPW